jgi:hypothetical protein
MIDIGAIDTDMRLYDTQVKKAENICAVQLGNLVYLPTFGVDLAYFLDESFEFQNEAFQAYVVQRLADYGIDVLSVLSVVSALYTQLNFNLSAKQENRGLIA